MTRHGKAIGTFLGTLLLAAGLTLGIGAPPALGGDVDVPTGGATFTLPDGERARIEFRVDIDDPLVPPETTEVCNQGTVSGTNITGSPVLTDDPALAAVDDPTCTTIDTVSDVSLNFSATGKAGPASVVDGNAIQYTITVENDGPDTATNVVVTDTVPSDLTSISTNGCDNDGGGASVSGFVVTCELPDLAKDGTDSFTINATVNVGGVGVLNNTAAVNADNDFGGPFNSNTVVTNVVVTLPLTVTVDGSGGGTVTAPAGPDPTMGGTGINCTKIGGDCTENYNPAVVVPLAATADAGSFFNGWTTCDNAMNGTCEETMDGTDSVTATFDDLPTLTVDKAGTGTGTVNINPSAGGGGAVDCTLDGGVDTDCEQDYDVDTAVALMATADAGSAFTGWMNCDSAVTNVCTQTVDGDETVTATFIRQFTLTIEVPGIMGTGDGRVTSLPEIDCGTTGTMDCT